MSRRLRSCLARARGLTPLLKICSTEEGNPHGLKPVKPNQALIVYIELLEVPKFEDEMDDEEVDVELNQPPAPKGPPPGDDRLEL